LAYRKIYAGLDYSIQDVEEAAGGKIALSPDKVEVLMGRMRNPSLSLHGIEGAFSGVGAKTVIPAKVSGKFSIRFVPLLVVLAGFLPQYDSLVPPQTPETVNPLVVKYIEEQFKSLNTKSKLEVECLHGGKPWVADHNHWNFEAAKRATWSVYKQLPDLTREGGSIPVTLTFAESLGVNVLLLPMGRGDDGAQ
jgi:Cys-Gly metallodipeptidase DUG1